MYLVVQWAAVKTHLLLMREPPQKDELPAVFVKITATCHGNCPFEAVLPFTIRPLTSLRATLP